MRYRKGYHHRKTKGLSVAAVKSVKQIVKKVTAHEIETKMLDTQVNTDIVNYLGTVYDLSTIVEGTDIFNRVGAIVKATHLDLRLNYYEQNPVLPSNRATLRFIVFRWLENTGSGVTPLVGVILDPISRATVPVPIIGTPMAPLAKYNTDWTKDVVIIWDSGALTTRNSTPLGSMAINKQINLRNAKIDYNAGAGISRGSGKIYLIAISDVSNLVAGNPTFSFVSRLLYKDG